ncbi:hypothetical protein LXL04_013866 [Taraxacum kok-saghyz]
MRADVLFITIDLPNTKSVKLILEPEGWKAMHELLHHPIYLSSQLCCNDYNEGICKESFNLYNRVKLLIWCQFVTGRSKALSMLV